MCGIVAMWQISKPVNQDLLKAATMQLRHRGPDEQNIWISSNKQIGLGHARLSIVDLITGSQPLTSTNGKIHVVVSGEFYDDVKIRKTLQRQGYEFKTHSDSEILLPLYQEYGLKCFEHLNGEFAFVLWDQQKQRLFAARDRFGIKPLYYTKYKGNIYFASEIKALMTLGIPTQWNQEFLSQQFYNVPFADQTCFKNIRQIKPGNYILVEEHNDKLAIIEKSYWDISFPTDSENTSELSEQEYCEQLETLLKKSIKRRLRADVPVACYLSGGIDSSTIAVLMAEQSKKPIDVYNVAFEESVTLNENKAAKALAKHIHANFHTLPVTMKDIADNYSNAIWHTEVYSPVGSHVAKYLLSKQVQQDGYKVVLTGEGADELLAGYPPLWVDCVRYSNHPEDLAIVPDIQAYFKKEKKKKKYRLPNRQAILKKLGYYPDLFLPITYNTEKMLSKDFFQKYYRHDPYLKFLRNYPINHQIAHGNMTSFIQAKTHFPIQTLNIVADRTEMAHSIEGRPPFLDTEFAEFCFNLPTYYKARGLVEKYILRQTMQHKLPQINYKKVKHAFVSPSFHANRKHSDIYKLMREVFYSDLLERVPFINPKVIRHTIDNLTLEKQKETQELEAFLHIILSSCFLAKLFNL